MGLANNRVKADRAKPGRLREGRYAVMTGVLLSLAALILVSASLAQESLGDFVSTDFARVDRIADLPAAVRDHLLGRFDENLSDHAPDPSLAPSCDVSGIANPGERFNSGCVVDCGIPKRQLIFGGVSDKLVFAYYLKGRGLGGPSVRLVVYQLKGGDPSVIYNADYNRREFTSHPATIDELKEALSLGADFGPNLDYYEHASW